MITLIMFFACFVMALTLTSGSTDLVALDEDLTKGIKLLSEMNDYEVALNDYEAELNDYDLPDMFQSESDLLPYINALFRATVGCCQLLAIPGSAEDPKKQQLLMKFSYELLERYRHSAVSYTHLTLPTKA